MINVKADGTHVITRDDGETLTIGPGVSPTDRDAQITAFYPTRNVYGPIEAWRFEAMIEIVGIKSQIDAAIDALPNPEKAVAKAKRARVTEYHRDDALIAALAPAVGLSDDDLDALWEQAQALG